MNPEKDTIQKDKDTPSSGGMGNQGTLLTKAEKLATAIYMVTSFMPADEPIKDRLRLVNLGLIGEISKASFGRSGKTIISSVMETTSLLNIALAMNLVSQMNHSILKREYDELLKRMEATPGLFKDVSLPISLNDGFFTQALPEARTADNKQTVYKGQNIIKDKNLSLKPATHQVAMNKGQKTVAGNKAAPVMGKKSSRREEILKVVRKMNKVTINDIFASLPSYGGKTIQRDLLSLVAQGILKKEGEKRWSRYFLA